MSLGCDKNLVDSEFMISLLVNAGHEIVDDPQEADACVVNTCSFINDAKEESISTLIESGELKKKNLKYLIATGCLSERYAKDFFEELPEVDACIGTTAYEELPGVLDRLVRGEKHITALKSIDYLPTPCVRRTVTTGGHYAYLKIAEGCNKHCTYCAIPGMRGKYRSYDPDRLVEEAETLAKNGCVELIIVAQETTVYGVDLSGRKMLPELLDRLCAIDGIRFIRLMYCYPEEIDDELIDCMARNSKICHYLDIPIQHASDTILRRMGRRTDKAALLSIVGKLRERIPDIVLRTSLISGFPGETPEDHAELLDFVEKTSFERLGVFIYSKEEGTPASKFDHQITKKVKLARQKEIMLLAQKMTFERNEKLVGSSFTAIVDGYLPDDGVYVCRTYMDAPGVDGYLFVEGDGSYLSGKVISVVITGADGYDLIGKEI